MHHTTLQPRADKGDTMLHIALKTIREYKQLTEAEMGRLLGYTEQAVKSIEEITVNLRLDILQVYSAALDIPVSGIVYISERIRDKQAAIDRFKAELENPDRPEVIELTRCTDLNLSLVVGAPMLYPHKAVQDILDYIDNINHRTPLQAVIIEIENLRDDIAVYYNHHGWAGVASMIELYAVRKAIFKTIPIAEFTILQSEILDGKNNRDGKLRIEDGKVKRDNSPCILIEFFGAVGAMLIADKIDQTIDKVVKKDKKKIDKSKTKYYY